MSEFAHLHLHTKYSLQDGVVDPNLLMKKCNDHGMHHVASTDHGNMAAVYDCAKYAKKHGINYIPGNEMYIVPDVYKCRGGDWAKRSASSHICLLAMDNKGYENLLLLTELSSRVGFYAEPRIDYKMLREYSEGLWCLTGCIGGVVGKAIANKQSPRLAVDRLYDIFGDRLSLEIQANDIPEQQVINEELFSIHRATNIPLVASIDAHYLDKSDSEKQDLLFAMQLKKTFADEDRYSLAPEEHSVEVPDEATARFINKYGALGRLACDRTLEIAENSHVDITIESKDYRIPSFDVLSQPDYQEFMKWRTGCECHTYNGECLIHGKDCDHDH